MKTKSTIGWKTILLIFTVILVSGNLFAGRGEGISGGDLEGNAIPVVSEGQIALEDVKKSEEICMRQIADRLYQEAFGKNLGEYEYEVDSKCSNSYINLSREMVCDRKRELISDDGKLKIVFEHKEDKYNDDSDNISVSFVVEDEKIDLETDDTAIPLWWGYKMKEIDIVTDAFGRVISSRMVVNQDTLKLSQWYGKDESMHDSYFKNDLILKNNGYDSKFTIDMNEHYNCLKANVLGSSSR